jgi:biopolymer transport protein ExbD
MTAVLILLAITVFLLAGSIYVLLKKTTYLTKKEKEFIIFVIDIFSDYGDELGVQTKEQHEKLVEELNKIKKKHLKNDET